jgi:hypothetical protein
LFEFIHIYIYIDIHFFSSYYPFKILAMARPSKNALVQKNLWILVFMILENTPMESNYRKYSFCFLFSTPKIMTSVFPLLSLGDTTYKSIIAEPINGSKFGGTAIHLVFL